MIPYESTWERANVLFPSFKSARIDKLHKTNYPFLMQPHSFYNIHKFLAKNKSVIKDMNILKHNTDTCFTLFAEKM